MKNSISVFNDITLIHITRRDGSLYYVIVDSTDVPLISDYTWGVDIRESGHTYAQSFYKSPLGYKKIYMHRLLTKAPAGLLVDHINHNTLDNRKTNIRLVTTSENNQNLLRARSDNHSSSVLGVHRMKRDGSYQVKLRADGILHWVGVFKTKDEAELAAIKARAKLLPFSKEAREIGITETIGGSNV